MATTVPEGEYDTQFFGFSPSSFIEGVLRLVDFRLTEGIDQLEQNLKKIPEEIISGAEISQGCDALREQTEKTFQKTADKMKGYILGSVMKVPGHVVLPGDLDQLNPAPASHLALLENELDSLLTQLKNERVFRARLKEELRQIDAVVDEQRKELDGPLSDATMTRLEEVREKMQFVGANVDKMVEVSGRLMNTAAGEAAGVASPACIMAQQAWE